MTGVRDVLSQPRASLISTRRKGEESRGSRGPERKDGRPERQRGPRPRRRKHCRLCEEQIRIDYKNTRTLSRFIGDTGKIMAANKTGACRKHQRELARTIKRARHLALSPYSREHIAGAQHRD